MSNFIFIFCTTLFSVNFSHPHPGNYPHSHHKTYNLADFSKNYYKHQKIPVPSSYGRKDSKPLKLGNTPSMYPPPVPSDAEYPPRIMENIHKNTKGIIHHYHGHPYPPDPYPYHEPKKYYHGPHEDGLSHFRFDRDYNSPSPLTMVYPPAEMKYSMLGKMAYPPRSSQYFFMTPPTTKKEDYGQDRVDSLNSVARQPAVIFPQGNYYPWHFLAFGTVRTNGLLLEAGQKFFHANNGQGSSCYIKYPNCNLKSGIPYQRYTVPNLDACLHLCLSQISGPAFRRCRSFIYDTRYRLCDMYSYRGHEIKGEITENLQPGIDYYEINQSTHCSEDSRTRSTKIRLEPPLQSTQKEAKRPSKAAAAGEIFQKKVTKSIVMNTTNLKPTVSRNRAVNDLLGGLNNLNLVVDEESKRN